MHRYHFRLCQHVTRERWLCQPALFYKIKLRQQGALQGDRLTVDAVLLQRQRLLVRLDVVHLFDQRRQ